MQTLTVHDHLERRRQLTPDLSDGFRTKEDLSRCLRWYNEGMSRRMRVQKSSKTVLRVVCSTLPRDGVRQRRAEGDTQSECKFFVAAGRRTDGIWTVRRAYLTHTCSAPESKPKARCKRHALTHRDVALAVEHVAATRPKHGTKAISIQQAAGSIGIQLVDKPTAWKALRAATLNRFGDPDDVSRLRPMLTRAKEKDADFVFDVVARPELQEGKDVEVLDKVFIAPGFMRRMVRDADGKLKRFVTCDGAHCRLGIMLTLVASDADHNLLPLAFAVVKSESTDTWTWFFTHATDAFPALTAWAGALTVVCDGDKGAAAAVRSCLPQAQRVVCVKHRLRNIARKFGSGARGDLIYGLFFQAAKAFTVPEHERAVAALRDADFEGWEYVMANDPQLWSNALYERRGWGKLTSNDSESFHGQPQVLEHRKSASIKSLLETCIMVTTKMVFERRLKYCSKVDGGDEYKYSAPYPPRVQDAFAKVDKRAKLLEATRMDEYLYSVGSLTGDGRHEVDLDPAHHAPSAQAGLCTCGVPRVLGRPCSHVWAACRAGNVSVELFVAPELATTAMRHLYSKDVMGRTGFCATSGLVADNLVAPPWHKRKNVVKADWADARGVMDDSDADDEHGAEGLAPLRPHNFHRRAASVRRRSAGEQEEALLLSQPQHTKRRRRSKQYKCGACGGMGHNRRKCPVVLERRQAEAARRADEQPTNV